MIYHFLSSFYEMYFIVMILPFFFKEKEYNVECDPLGTNEGNLEDLRLAWR